MKVLTLCFIFHQDQILLGQKKRGFGEGKWNGFGGKLEEGESIEDAMKREILEESGVRLISFRKIGVVWESCPTWSDQLEVHIFISTEFTGTPVETEEMRPQWFPVDCLPAEMWAGDKIWFPRMMEGRKVCMFIELNKDNQVVRYI